MNRDNARELKARVLSGISREMNKTASSFLAEIGSLRIPRHSESIAAGISHRSHRDCRLELRIQARGAVADRLIEQVLPRRAAPETRIRQVGRVLAPRRVPATVVKFRRRIRPLQCGYSVGHFRVTAGTVGAFAKDPDGNWGILSNNHVLANVNRAQFGEPILQPGRADATPVAGNIVGALSRYMPISSMDENYIDAAFAELEEGKTFYPHYYDGFYLNGICDIEYSTEEVMKIGRTTGRTIGQITATEVDGVIVNMGNNSLARFDNQIEIEGLEGPFSKGGDSGSLIIDDDVYGVGLLFAGSETGGENGHGLTYANPLTTVLAELELEM